MREGVVSRNTLDILAVLIDPESCDERLGKMNHGDTFKHLFPEQGSNKFGLFPPSFICVYRCYTSLNFFPNDKF